MSVPELSVDLHRLVAGWAAGLPDYVGTAADIATDAVVGVFVLLFALLLWRARREGSRDEQARAIVAPIAMVVAYLVSRTAKSLVEQDRPCRSMDVISECPPVGDWSFPSNHSAIAGAAAVAIVMCDRRQRWVVPVALLAGASRVFVGVHYPHDVLAGLLLGALVAAIMQKLAPLLPVPAWFAAPGNPEAAERGAADPRPCARATPDNGRPAGRGDALTAGRTAGRDEGRDAVAAKAEAALVSAAVNAAVSAAVGAAMGGPEAKAASRSIAASKALAEAARAELRRTSGDEPAQPTPTRVAQAPAATRLERLPDPTTAVQVAVTGAGDEATRMVQVSVVGAPPTRALPTPAPATDAPRAQVSGAEPTRALAAQGVDQTRALAGQGAEPGAMPEPGADPTRAMPAPGAEPTRALAAPGVDQTRALAALGVDPTKALSAPGGAAATRVVQAPSGGAAHGQGAEATRVQPAGAGAESTRVVRLPGARPDRGQAETEVLARVSADDAPPPRVESTRMVPLSGTTGAPPQVPAPLNLTRALPRSGSLQGLAGAPGGRRRAADQATVPAAEPVTPVPGAQGPGAQGPSAQGPSGQGPNAQGLSGQGRPAQGPSVPPVAVPPASTPPASTPPVAVPPAINPAAAAALAADLPAASTPATALFAAPGTPVATPAPAGFPGGRPTDPDAADTAVIHGLFRGGDHGPAAPPAPSRVPSPAPTANSTPTAAHTAAPTPPDAPRAPRRPVPPRDPATTDVLPRI
ncbi:phosphatase PAP2 family protein [Actinosynnema pretiosum]|uniref:Phosphatidic acid phosphatase type 2/haloperoxidase domain-containing protein n=1 Tax=Actinosynnema pretiosum TaxID=42197 RepID=A0A290Z2P9_9PSEU|nr:phosphatase PAP2 family protein [Actinosynnema pretiosum]ATE53223.1 hypothetical protein CNX65_07910 [Actinosynnema pretiosum]